MRKASMRPRRARLGCNDIGKPAVPPWWADNYAVGERVVEFRVVGASLVARTESGTKYVVGFLADIWPLPKGETT